MNAPSRRRPGVAPPPAAVPAGVAPPPVAVPAGVAPPPVAVPAGAITPSPLPDDEPRLRIGEAASKAAVSTRTLRYYQELGLLTPAGTTAGGARRYSDADVARIERIRHLQGLVGFDLTEIRRVLTAEDRLAAIRREWWQGLTPRRKAELLRECIAINADLQAAVQAKMAGLHDFLAGLEERAEVYRRAAGEIALHDAGELTRS